MSDLDVKVGVLEAKFEGIERQATRIEKSVDKLATYMREPLDIRFEKLWRAVDAVKEAKPDTVPAATEKTAWYKDLKIVTTLAALVIGVPGASAGSAYYASLSSPAEKVDPKPVAAEIWPQILEHLESLDGVPSAQRDQQPD